MLTFLDRFGAYAADFERTYVDDDWTRLEPYFAEDAVYEVKNAPFACRIEGRAAILAGLRKSVNGFDRRFDLRRVEVTSAPELLPAGIAVSWQGIYEKEGAPTLTIAGRSEARYRDDRIVYLSDTYSSDLVEPIAAWMREHGAGFDASYT